MQALTPVPLQILQLKSQDWHYAVFVLSQKPLVGQSQFGIVALLGFVEIAQIKQFVEEVAQVEHLYEQARH